MERKCSKEDCDSRHYCKGYCIKHYRRFKKYGSPDALKRRVGKGLGHIERFMAFVEVAESGCWEWTGALCDGRYASFAIGRKFISGHRFAMEYLKGESAEGLQVRHTCDNMRCVNPDHLLAGTHQDNMDDKVERNRQVKGSAVSTAKINEGQAEEIRASTDPVKLIAEKYGLCLSTVYRIKNGQHWKK